jgi:hypothetical protein
MERTVAALTRHVRGLQRPLEAEHTDALLLQYPHRDQASAQALAVLAGYPGLLNPEQSDFSASSRSSRANGG